MQTEIVKLLHKVNLGLWTFRGEKLWWLFIIFFICGLVTFYFCFSLFSSGLTMKKCQSFFLVTLVLNVPGHSSPLSNPGCPESSH